MTADEAFAQSSAREMSSALEDAKAFLLDALREGPQQVQDLKRNAQEEGIAYRTLERARQSLPIKTRRSSTGLCWWEWDEPGV